MNRVDWHNPPPEIEEKRAKIMAEINANVVEKVSFERFKKTDFEKNQLKVAKLNHKNYVKAYGYDPKKVMNVPISNGEPVRNG